jgi:hypothetical protein
MAEKDYLLFQTGIIAQDEQGEWDFWDRDAEVLKYNSPDIYHGEDSNSGETLGTDNK